ncbi:MAG: nucleoside phosphorylase [Lewinellaceae bacterium]|nr:nucleoside phosphorylase [Lewinellaceae bacterium]
MHPSELILNKSGSIYHLDLHPEQIAPLIITVGDPNRVKSVSKHFDSIEHEVSKREFITHTGFIGQKRISVISTGIGPDNIDIVLNELDALFNIDLESRIPKSETQQLTIIRLGTCGGLQAGNPVDSFVASSGALGMDGLMQFYQAASQQNHPILAALREHCADDWEFPLKPYFSRGSDDLLHIFQTDFQQGFTMTNPGFYGPQGRQLRAPVRQPNYLDLMSSFEYDGTKILNLEMETAAIYGLSQLLGHRAISLSVILANRALGKFSSHSAKSVEKLIETSIGIIDQKL